MYPYVFLCFFECIALNHVKSLGKPSVHRLPGSIVSRCPSLCRSGCGVQLHGFQRFGDFYGVYNRVYICIYVSLQTASLIRNMMNYDVVCRQTHVAGLWTCTWMCSVFFLVFDAMIYPLDQQTTKLIWMILLFESWA